MRRHAMPEAEALRRIRPRSPKARRQLLLILAFVLIVAVLAAGSAYLTSRQHQYREDHWNSAVATVEDARPVLVSQINTGRGGAMLYKVQVLVKFSASGVEQLRWITVDQAPNILDYVAFQGRMWKGKRCFVSWDPNNSHAITIDLH